LTIVEQKSLLKEIFIIKVSELPRSLYLVKRSIGMTIH